MQNKKTKKYKYFGPKSFYKYALSIIIPVILHQIILSVSSYADNIMLNFYSVNSFNGVAIANKLLFILILFSFGVASGISVFIAQYHGAKKEKELIGNMQLGLLLVIILGLLITLLLYFFGPKFIKLFLNKNETDHLNSYNEGVKYIKIIALGTSLFLLEFMVSFILRSIGKTKEVMIAGLISVCVNISLNYLLIFGKLGFQSYGVKGAAVATLISKAVEIIILIIIGLKIKDSYFRNFFKSFNLNKLILKKYFKKGFIIIFNETLWASGVVIAVFLITANNYNWITSYNYAQNIIDIFLIFFAGFGAGVSVICGNSLGEGNFEYAKKSANYLKGLLLVATLITVVLMISLSPALLLIFTSKNDNYFTAYYIILIVALFLIFYSYESMAYLILRAGGESFKAFILDQYPTYMFALPVLLILYNYNKDYKINVIYLFLIYKFTDFIKSILGYFLLKKESWVKNITIEENF